MSSFSVSDGGALSRISLGIGIAINEYEDRLQKALNDVGQEAVTHLAAAAPEGTGRTEGHLRDSFESRPYERGVAIVTTQAQKLRYVRQGTGVYGKFGTPIVPTTQQAMWWPEAGYPRTQVAGQRANDFVTPILDDITTYAVPVIADFALQLALLIEGKS